MKPEILPDLALEAYHDPSNGMVSHSRFKEFVDHGPRWFYERFISGEKAREEKPAFDFGQAFEELFQRGGEVFSQLVAVRPAHLKGNTTAG